MVGLVKGRQRIGKSTWITGLAWHLCMHGGYEPREIIANYHLFNEDGSPLDGYHYCNNQQIKQVVTQMVDRRARHLIILVDEIDRVFSHRTWHKPEQIDALVGLWQDEKMFYNVWGTAHLGLSVDSLIREIAQVEIIVQEKNVVADKLVGVVINSLNKEVFGQEMHHLSVVQKLFDSWEPIV